MGPSEKDLRELRREMELYDSQPPHVRDWMKEHFTPPEPLPVPEKYTQPTFVINGKTFYRR